MDMAKLAAELNHPNIVHIYDLGKIQAGGYFIAMEYVDGRDLRTILQSAKELGTPLPPPLAVYVASKIAAAKPDVAPVVEVIPGALRVLIADDNALNQNLLKRLVVKLGHSVDVVSNGREAVAAVAQEPYDALLMDVLMPEMDGLQAAEAICRRWTKGTRPRLIALTALAGPGDQDRCLKAGFDDYMIKPVHLEQLKEAFKVAAGWRTNP